MASTRPPLAAILSVAGLSLSDAEKRLFADSHPAGFILFGRNCADKAQLKALTDDLKQTVGWNCPILIDQEGGKVARLKPPVWPEWPAASRIGKTFEQDMDAGYAVMHTVAQDLALHLTEVGINVNCAPVLDVGTPAMTEAIGSRCYSTNPAIVAAAGQAMCDTFLAHGVTPVVKHLPGHGRATVDSHYHLPHLDATLADLRKADYPPFASVLASANNARIWGMVAHLMIPALDTEMPSSLSTSIIRDVIRGELGLQGLLVTDDLDMQALKTYGDCTARALISVEAGCDLALYCHGDFTVMSALVAALPPMTDAGQARLAASGFHF